MIWNRGFAEQGEADRHIALRNRPDLIPVEERKNIVSNRVHAIDPNTDTKARLESGLEDQAMTILKSDPKVVRISTQYGPVMFMRNGKWHQTYFDLCVDYANGCRTLYAIRNKKASDDLEIDLDLIREQSLHKHAHYAKLWTEEEHMTKPAIYRAWEIAAARKAGNDDDADLVLQALMACGGRARVAKLLCGIPGIAYSVGWSALWLLIGRGMVEHHHDEPLKTFLKKHSFVRVVEK
ncbi:hypothetical protein AAIH70_16475 [Neorhizobium sp. BT27B]|uniref:hypothetical protein n=1 Tax=Neorhizobium sp. BT27B TaxID=3142625 RepID=UPI003D279F9C